jgi:hypothetical protein
MMIGHDRRTVGWHKVDASELAKGKKNAFVGGVKLRALLATVQRRVSRRRFT